MLSGVEKYQHSCLLSLGLTTLTDNIINYAKKYPPLPLSYYTQAILIPISPLSYMCHRKIQTQLLTPTSQPIQC